MKTHIGESSGQVTQSGDIHNHPSPSFSIDTVSGGQNFIGCQGEIHLHVTLQGAEALAFLESLLKPVSSR